MAGKFVYYVSFLFATLISNSIVHSSEENRDNAELIEVEIDNKKPLIKMEPVSPTDPIKLPPGPPAVIQFGNNLFIKPKFIVGSPFTSNKQGTKTDGCCNNVSITSKGAEEETSILIGKPQNPPVIPPPEIESDISISRPSFPIPIEPVIPTVLPYPWQPLRLPTPCGIDVNIPILCSPYAVPISSEFVKLPRLPTPTEKPVPPIVIPKPPMLPPIVLPKFPIQVTFDNKIFTEKPDVLPIPDQSIFIPSLCPPMVKCIAPERKLPSVSNVLSVIFDKFKNLLSIPTRVGINNFEIPDEIILTPELRFLFPTVCAQDIIAERVVPNIVNKDVKILMSPIFSSQSTNFYSK